MNFALYNVSYLFLKFYCYSITKTDYNFFLLIDVLIFRQKLEETSVGKRRLGLMVVGKGDFREVFFVARL